MNKSIFDRVPARRLAGPGSLAEMTRWRVSNRITLTPDTDKRFRTQAERENEGDPVAESGSEG